MGKRRLDNQTRMGINFMRYGLYVSIVMNVLYGIFFFIWSYDPRGNLSRLACFLGIFAIAVGVLFLVAIYKLYKGAESSSFEHAWKVKIAVVLIIVGFSFGIVSPSLQTGSIEAFRSSMLTASELGLIQRISYAFAMVLLIHELAGKKARRYLYVGASLLIILSISRLIWSAFFIPQEGAIEDVLITTLRMLSILMLALAAGYFFLSVGYTKTVRPGRG